MPEMFQQVLTQREIRDLAAYLAGLNLETELRVDR